MNQKLLHILWILILFTVSNDAAAGGLGGTVYVPNLHAKCLSSHQERMLACAMLNYNETMLLTTLTCTKISSTTPEELDCAKSSLTSYRRCEANLTKLRALDTLVPIIPKVYNTSTILKQLYEAEYGGYPE